MWVDVNVGSAQAIDLKRCSGAAVGYHLPSCYALCVSV